MDGNSGTFFPPDAPSSYPAVIGPPTVTLRAVGLSEEDFIELVCRTSSNEPVAQRLLSRIQAALGLVQPPVLPPNPVDWSQSFPLIDSIEEPSYVSAVGGADLPFAALPYLEQVDHLLSLVSGGPEAERKWQTVFPFRVKGEAALRRMRLSDLPQIFDITGLRDTLLRLKKTRSYIFVLNCCLMDWLTRVSYGWSYVEWFHGRGGLENIPTFLAAAKTATIKLKSTVYPDAYLPLVEGTGMAGYRLLPDPSFDIVAATRDASEGFGDQHTTTDGLARPFGWMDCSFVLDVAPVVGKEVLSFEEFVSDPSNWATSGSSSFGRLAYREVGADRWSWVKARKLVLKYVTDPQTLISLAKDVTVTLAVSLVKSELAKIRIAVASMLGFYLIWAFLHHLYGDLYPKWPGVTLGETPKQEALRIEAMLDACSTSFGFPADFESFDRQPLTTEIVRIGQALVSAAERTASLPAWLSHAAIFGLEHSDLSTPRQPDGRVHTFRVRDYLPSGIAITSGIGNGFNCVASESMIRLVEAWTRRPRSSWLLRCDLRGDDSNFQVTHVGYALLLSLAARVLSYRHAPNKVAVLWQATELLRVSFSAEYGARGLPARLVPTLSQRKPWSNEPWDAEGSIVAQWDTCAALERRRMSGLKLWDRISLVWQRKRGLSRSALSASRMDGGLGLGPPSELLVRVVPAMKTQPAIAAEVRVGAWASELEAARFARFGLSAPPAALLRLVEAKAVATLGTVDLPVAARLGQDAYKRELRSTHVTVRPRPAGASVRLDTFITEMSVPFRSCERYAELENLCLSLPATWFASFPHYIARLVASRDAEQYELGCVPLDSTFTYKAGVVSRLFRCPRTIAEDWLAGSHPSMSFGCVHPTLTDLLLRPVCGIVEAAFRCGLGHQLGLGQLCRVASWRVGSALFNSPLHKRCFSW